MTALDLDAIRYRLNAATPGPWGVGNGTNIVRGLEVTGRGSYTCIQSVAEIGDDRCDWDRDEAVETDPEDDAAFIAAARQDIPDLLDEVDRLRAKLDGPCGSCHPCNNWADETWRRANRTPPTVQEWDDLRAQAAATLPADGCPVHVVPQPDDCAPCRESAEPTDPVAPSGITDRELLISIRQWLRDEGWWLGWTGWTDQFGELASTVIVDWDEDELRVRRRTAEQAGKSWPVGYGRHERYPVTSVRQAVDILVVLEVLPARFSSAYRAALAGAQ